MKEIPELCRNKSECCGCAICSVLCSRGAITMVADEEGYLYPQIDEVKCVRCGVCIKLCAFKKEQKEKGRV